MQIQTFLRKCATSSSATSDAFLDFLFSLENPKTRKSALLFWNNLASHLNSEELAPAAALAKYHFCIQESQPRLMDGTATTLTLLVLPSTFTPEEWSFTFFEGLSRYSPLEFRGKRVAELGCGIGWITLALAKLTSPAKIYGLDINPKAILCSKINLYLNAQFDPSLLERVEFLESDLLKVLSEPSSEPIEKLDRIIGCIPQVLSPDPKFGEKLKNAAKQNDSVLQSLSNYTIDQGYLEDQFGLGLIARTVEESVAFLSPSGKLILNLGGRPGTQLLTQLFLRRGFRVRSVWKTRVAQAKDTDIEALVQIEKKTPHRFEFYLNGGGDVPIPAKTARAFVQAGGEISHSLIVYEAVLRDPTHTYKVFEFLSETKYKAIGSELDLSYSDDTLATEKLSFLSYLADYLKGQEFFPYEATAGLLGLKTKLSSFFSEYYGIPWCETNFLITPSRTAICSNILTTYRPEKVLVDSSFGQALRSSFDFLEAPHNSEVLSELIETLRPQAVLYSMPAAEAESSGSFAKLCELSKNHGCALFLDISEVLELSSNPSKNGIFRFLSKNSLPPSVTLLGGLVKNKLYQDLEICFVISENKGVLHDLERAAELTYCRTPLFSQAYYERILEDLLSFRMRQTSKGKPREPMVSSHAVLAPSAKLAFAHPAVHGEDQAREPGLIRLDYGENALPSAEIVHQSLFEAYSRKNLDREESDCVPEILELTEQRFNATSLNPSQVLLGTGVSPLFACLAQYVHLTGMTFIFPEGTYGHFHASAIFHGCRISVVPTHLKNSFKLDAVELDRVLKGVPDPEKACVVLSAPIVNPTGCRYTPPEVQRLLEVVEHYSCTILLDCIFSGLEFDVPKKSEILSLDRSKAKWLIFGGVSKEFAAGGLRLGYLVASVPVFNAELSRHPIDLPHLAITYAAKRVYRALLDQDERLLAHQNKQRLELANRAKQLTQVLEKKRWTVLKPHGGLFLCAAPDSSVRDLDGLCDQIRMKSRVVINSPSWTGIPRYFRFVLSTVRSEFDEALARLSAL